jgi:hypothetical protein
VKLNLGCGDDIRDGYVNVDFRKTHPTVLEVDLSKFPWPFDDQSADEILMLDFLEHFPYATTPFILLECYRVLKADGSVVIQVPDATHLTMALTAAGPFLCNRCGTSMHDRETSREVGNFVAFEECPGCIQHKGEIADAAVRRLYGGQDYPGNFHQNCFTQEQLMHQAYQAGLKVADIEEHDYQYANWNLKLRFWKGDLW